MSTPDRSIAKRIPFTFVSHMSGEREHSLMHENTRLNLRVETHTKYWHGKPCKTKAYYYVGKPASQIYDTLIELLEANPDIAALAEQAYGASHD